MKDEERLIKILGDYMKILEKLKTLDEKLGVILKKLGYEQ